MINYSPISPPPELVSKWCYEDGEEIKSSPRWFFSVCAKAARWGADQELQACINFVYDNELCDPNFYNNLRAARRPKPLTLKERALETFDKLEHLFDGYGHDGETIREALEALPSD